LLDDYVENWVGQRVKGGEHLKNSKPSGEAWMVKVDEAKALAAAGRTDEAKAILTDQVDRTRREAQSDFQGVDPLNENRFATNAGRAAIDKKDREVKAKPDVLGGWRTRTFRMSRMAGTFVKNHPSHPPASSFGMETIAHGDQYANDVPSPTLLTRSESARPPGSACSRKERAAMEEQRWIKAHAAANRRVAGQRVAG
jgi:hypothetical protein